MAFIGRMLSNVASFYKEINSATLTGAIDVVVIEQPDRRYLSSPFHVRFGKMGVMRSKEKVVDILINDEPVEIQMKLGDGGEAFFVQSLGENDDYADVPEHLATSPLPYSVDQSIFEAHVDKLREESSKQIPENRSDLSKLRPIQSVANFQIHEEDEEEQEDTKENLEEMKKVLRTELKQKKLRKKKREAAKQTKSDEKKQSNRAIRRVKSWAGTLFGFRDDKENKENQKAQRRKSSAITSSTQKTSSLFKKPRSKASDSSPSMMARENSTYSSAADMLSGRKISTKSDGSHYSTASSEDVTQVQFDLEGISDEESPGSQDTTTAEEDSSREATQPADRPSLLKIDMERQESDEEEEGGIMLKVRSGGEREGTPIRKNQSEGQLSSSLPERLKEEKESKMKLTGLNPYFHPFSDTDITPSGSREGSRAGTPGANTRSDTELDRIVFKEEMGGDEPEWKWGEFPDKTPTEENPNPNLGSGAAQAEGSGWGLSSMLGLGQFMRRTRKVRHNPEAEGIYLDDLVSSNEMDPKLAALYFPKSRLNNIQGKEEKKAESEPEKEAEVSVDSPSSPVESPRGAVGSDDAGYSSNQSSIAGDHTNDLGEVALSLCGGLNDSGEGTVSEDKFTQHMVEYEQLNSDPTLLFNENLVLRVNGKFYNWKQAAPMLVSMLAFQQPLSQNAIDRLRKPSGERSGPPSGGGVSSWFYWRRAASVDPPSATKHVEETVLKRAETPQPAAAIAQENTGDVSKNKPANEPSAPIPVSAAGETSPTTTKTCRKTLRLSSDQLKSLNLKPGCNEARFSVTTKYQGTTYCICHIYLWRWDDKIVISDIDGTITKSDVLGQILPVVGGQWAQAGVANLFTRIYDNAYQIAYLSARAIGQSGWTKDYLRSLKQDDHGLPQGPLLLSPTSLISAFHREVIERKPEEFKKSCLNDIKALFPREVKNPLYAGFGNKINDVWAYQAVGIPISRIFSINHLGEVRHELTRGFSSTYKRMSTEFLDHMFPPLSRARASILPDGASKELRMPFPSPEEFSGYTFWRPSFEVDIELDKFPGPSSPKNKKTPITDVKKKEEPKKMEK